MNDTITPAHEALDAFRRFFSIPLMKVTVSEDGNRISYDLTGCARFDEYRALAETIVLVSALPLKVSKCSFGFGVYLVLEFDSSKLIPVNY
jgi:hypothetical protein